MRFGSPDTDRLAVTSLMAEGDTAGAVALAETLPDRYGFTGSDLEEHGDYMRLLHLYCDLKGTGRTVDGLTEGELSMAKKIAEEGRGMSRAMAETLLEGAMGDRGKTVCPPDYMEEQHKGTEGKGSNAVPDNRDASAGMSVRLSPSPATSFATVEYVLPKGATQATLDITNVLGVTVLTVGLEGNRGSGVLDLSGQPSGLYFITVTDQNGQRCVRKVVKQ